MRKRLLLISVICTMLTAAMGSLMPIASAEEPTPAQTPADPTIDRDGQRICGYDLMNDSEKAGYRNIMHKTSARADRDEIRTAHCEAMKKRAQEKEKGGG
jgi:hypothetical protein